MPDMMENPQGTGPGPGPERGHGHRQIPAELDDGSRLGYVHSAETTSGVNGPGVRYTVFMSGCPLRCQYCHNPDTQQMRLGDRTTVRRVINETAKYVKFLSRGGGLTCTGGEPLMQAPFIEDLFVGVKEELDGLHTALDTSGIGGHKASDRLIEHTDLVLLDIKAGDPEKYAQVTGGADFAQLLEFAARLVESKTHMWIRFVLVPGLTADPDTITKVAGICSDLGEVVDRVEVLPYHTLGVDKYKALGRTYPLQGTPSPNREQVELAVEIFRNHGLNTIV